jgi:hypothetical protein
LEEAYEIVADEISATGRKISDRTIRGYRENKPKKNPLPLTEEKIRANLLKGKMKMEKI